jgi:hypothetical protein
VKGHNVGRIFWELDFAIRHSFMARSHVQAALLEQGWPLFQCLQLEELLIPLVRALAQTLKDDRQAATAFLRAVWDGKQLFEPSDLPKLQELQLRPPTLISVGTLLAELTVDQDQTRILSDIEQLRRCEEDIRLPTNTVEVRCNEVRLHPANYCLEPQDDMLLRPGMQYIGAIRSDNVALVTVYNSPPLPCSDISAAPSVVLPAVYLRLLNYLGEKIGEAMG